MVGYDTVLEHVIVSGGDRCRRPSGALGKGIFLRAFLAKITGLADRTNTPPVSQDMCLSAS